MTVNVDRCLQLAQALAERAAARELPAPTPLPKFDMNEWALFKGQQYTPDPNEVVICKTVGCIAGSALALFDPDRYREHLSVRWLGNISAYAATLLGLDDGQETALFTPRAIIGKIKVEHAVEMLGWLADNPDANGASIRNHWDVLVCVVTPEREYIG